MSKYWQFLIRAFIRNLAYRSEIVVWLFLDFIPIFADILMWITVFGSQDQIRGLSLNQVIQYFVLGLFFNGLSAVHFEGWRVEEIRNGKIDYFLIRPLSYLWEIVLTEVAGKVFYILCLLPFSGLAILFLTSFTQAFSWPLLSWSAWAAILSLMLTAYLIEMALGLLTVILGFWFEGAEGLEHFKWMSVVMLSGFFIPIPFMPTIMKQVVLSLPFKYMYAVPIGIFQGTYVWSWSEIFYPLSLALVLMVGNYYLFKLALKSYCSSGG